MIKAVICDDELATRNIICHFLEEEQLPIEIVGNAEDGKEAIQLIKETSPRLIFLDIHMPQKNGFQVIEEVSREVGAQIIVLTAFASFENAQQALRAWVSVISCPNRWILSSLKQLSFALLAGNSHPTRRLIGCWNIFIIIIKKTWNWRISPK